jgi:hypothetical protein
MSEQEELKTNNQESQIEDLPTNDEQAEDVKAGAVVHGTTVLAWARVDGTGA